MRTHIAIATTAAGPNYRPCDRLRALACVAFTQKSSLAEPRLRQPE